MRLFNAMRARQLLVLGFQHWSDYENLNENHLDPRERHLDTCLFLAKQAMGFLEQPKHHDEKSYSTYVAESFFLAKNNLAYYLAEKNNPKDYELAMMSSSEIRETADGLRRKGDPRWFEMQETYAKVVLAYSRDHAKRIEACQTLEELASNTALPEDWRQSIKEKFRGNCPDLA